MKNFFVIICVMMLVGCMAPSLDNKFVFHVGSDKIGFISQCKHSFLSEYFYSKDDIIDRKHIYNFIEYDNGKIYTFKDNQFIMTDVHRHIGMCYFCIIPIEYCNDEWCKIYYPCGDADYFVKKDDIKPYEFWKSEY